MKDYEIDELRRMFNGHNPKGFCYMGYPIEEIPIDLLHKIIVDLAQQQKSDREFNMKFDKMMLDHLL